MMDLMMSRATQAVESYGDRDMEKRKELIKSYQYLISRYKDKNNIDNTNISDEELLEKSVEDFEIKMEKLSAKLCRMARPDEYGDYASVLHTLDPAMFAMRIRNFELRKNDISLEKMKCRYILMNAHQDKKYKYIDEQIEHWAASYEMEIGILQCFGVEKVKACKEECDRNDKKFANIAQIMIVDYICEKQKEVTDKFEFVKNMSEQEVEDILCNGYISFSDAQIEYLKENLVKSII